MKIFSYIFLLIILNLSSLTLAQNIKYWVLFKDKKDVTFNPYQYFDTKAIERRINNNISLFDSSDFPLKPYYVNEVSRKCKILSQSRWLNAVAVIMDKSLAYEISQMSCVKNIIPIKSYSVILNKNKLLTINDIDEDLLKKQIQIMQGQLFKENHLDGTGVRIAIFDGGFPGVDVNPVFEHIRKENRIINTYDFVKKKDFVYDYNSHGAMVLACIAGIYNGQNIGMATGAEFLLARTETWTELISEEENWMAAVEWADKNGADIISSSLGYTFQRYFTTDMDGKTSLVVKAANMAAAKGILVINAMGNEGSKKWKIMCTPADGDSVLSVGGINPDNLYHIDFSSYGPTADFRMKPNVSAFAKVSTIGKKSLETAYGTSFSTPLVTGFAACVWQKNKNWTNMQLFHELEKSGDLYPYYDYAHGFGVPQASYFTDSVKTPNENTFELKTIDNNLIFKVIKTHIEINSLNNYLYYHIENNKGYLDKYVVVNLKGSNYYNINLDSLEDKKIQIYYKSYTETYENKKHD